MAEHYRYLGKKLLKKNQNMPPLEYKKKTTLRTNNVSALFFTFFYIVFIISNTTYAKEEISQNLISGILENNNSISHLRRIYYSPTGGVYIPYTPDIEHNSLYTIYHLGEGAVEKEIKEIDLQKEINKIDPQIIEINEVHMVPENWPTPVGLLLGKRKIALSDQSVLTENFPFPDLYCPTNNIAVYKKQREDGSFDGSFAILLRISENDIIKKYPFCDKRRGKTKYLSISPDIFVLPNGILFYEENTGYFLFIEYNELNKYTSSRSDNGLIFIGLDKVLIDKVPKEYNYFDKFIEKILNKGQK